MSSSGIQTLHEHVKNTLAQTDSGSDVEESSEKKDAKDISDKNIEDYGLEWQNLNHSVTIIGWGTDAQTGQKYWIVRNSYGSRWGDKGEFMVQRGTDDFGIESETTGY
jgi:C1A family cysteine protease